MVNDLLYVRISYAILQFAIMYKFYLYFFDFTLLANELDQDLKFGSDRANQLDSYQLLAALATYSFYHFSSASFISG